LARSTGATTKPSTSPPFFELLAIHELTHVFLDHGRVDLPRLWLAELACNLDLHGYVASEEPNQLPVLETLPLAIAACDPERVTYRSLADFEERYAFGMDPLNYAWYQCRLHRAAASTTTLLAPMGCGSSGRRFAMPNAPGHDGDMGDDVLTRLLDEAVDASLGDVIRSWG
jgi:hypothetical protein